MNVQAIRAPEELAAGVKRPRGRPRKTEDERDDGNRRLELLNTAARLFRRKGYDATTTRDIAAAVGMRSGSPFYHFKSKNALLFAVMEEGMRSAIERQTRSMERLFQPDDTPRQRLHGLIRSHFDVLLGPDSDFIPVMLYEWRALSTRQKAAVAQLQSEYESPWLPELQALRDAGQLHAEVHLARLLIFGALNWSAQWFNPKSRAPERVSLDELADAALNLFVGGPA